MEDLGLVFGLKCYGLLAIYDRDTSSWKTLERSLFGESIPYSEHWPRSGMTRNGKLYRLHRLARRTEGSASISWPTPRSQDRESFAAGIKRDSPSLQTMVRMWPTPRTAGMCGGTGNWNQLKDKCENIEEARAMGAGNGGQLNPVFVEYLMNYPKGWTDLDSSNVSHYTMGISIMGDNNAKTQKDRSSQELPVLREATHEENNQRQNGGSVCISETEILQSGLHGKGIYQEECGNIDNAQKGAKIQKKCLPDMRNENRASSSSSRRESDEQCTEQLNNLVQFLSSEMALDSWEEESKAPDCMQNMRRAFEEIGYVPETLPEIQEVWRSISDEEKDWIKIRISTRHSWCEEWPGVPRVASSIPSRVDRLKCLGNAIVPQCAEVIFNLPAFDEWRKVKSALAALKEAGVKV